MISIIILNFNTFDLTCACIHSIISNTVGVEYEIILVDNGSTECTAELFSREFPAITLVKNARNEGFAGGNNCGLAAARGEHVLLLNSDTAFTCNVLPRCAEYMRDNPWVGALTTRLIGRDGRPQPVINRFPSITRELAELFRLQKFLPRRNLLLGEFFDYQTPVAGDWIWGAFFFIRRDTIEKFPRGVLPDDFFLYFEDVQWGFSLKDLHYRAAFAPLGDVVHYGSASSNFSKDDEKLRVVTAHEKTFFLARNGPTYLRLLYLARALTNLTARNFRIFAFYCRHAFSYSESDAHV